MIGIKKYTYLLRAMNRLLYHKSLWWLLLLLLMVNFSTQANSQQEEHRTKIVIDQLYQALNKRPAQSMSQRIEYISSQFLRKPYLFNALGEGPQAYFDQAPRYRSDAFDCETFVDTVLGIALAENFQGFEQCINRIRYKTGKPQFTARNHFTDLDWNKNNQRLGYLQDVTAQIKNPSGKKVNQMASATIDKPTWYKRLPISRIRIVQSDESIKIQRWQKLQKKGKKFSSEVARIPYIPLNALFDSQKRPNHYIFAQIPDGAIVEIVRPNWDLRQQIGTCLNVSHLGFTFWKNGALIFREASSEQHAVVDVPFIDYLQQALSSPTIKGINIQIIKPTTATTSGCC